MSPIQAARPLSPVRPAATVRAAAVRPAARAAEAAAPAPKKPEVSRSALEAFEPIIRQARYESTVAGNALAAKQAEHDKAAAEFGKAVEAARRLTGDNTALYQARIDRLEGYLKDAESKLAHARTPGLAKALELEAEAGRVGRELTDAQAKLSGTKTRISWLRQDIVNQQSRLDRAERNKRDAESDISRLEWQVSPSKISAQQSRVRSAQWDVDRAESKVSSARSSVSSLESRISAIESEIRSLQSSTDPGASSKISSLRSELSGVKSRLSSAESDLSRARSELSGAESDLRRERAELSRLEGLMRELEDARDRRSQAIREINAATDELAAHRRELPEQEALVPVTEARITDLTANRAELARRAQALRGPKNAESHPQVVEAKQAVENLRAELARAQKTFEDRTADPRAELAAAQALFESQMAPFRAAVTTAEAAATAAKAVLDGYQNALAELARHAGGFEKFAWRLSGFNLDAFMAEQLKD